MIRRNLADLVEAGWWYLDPSEHLRAAEMDLTLRKQSDQRMWLDAADWRVFWCAKNHGYDWRRGRVPVKKAELHLLKKLGATIHRFLPELPSGCAIRGEVSREDYAALVTMRELCPGSDKPPWKK